MESQTFVTGNTVLPWKRCVQLTLLLVQLCALEQAAASCRILRCNSDFVAATLDLGGGGGVRPPGGAVAVSGAVEKAGYCGALRSYATCTKRMARACRGDLAYHSAVQGIEDLLTQHRCPRAGPTPRPRPLPRETPSADDCLYERGFPSGEGHVSEHVHCGVFGDPHVRTFDHDFQTCGVQGAWPLVDNDYLFVQATSSPSSGGRSTALTKITVIFKATPQCLQQQSYQAELDHVPAAFSDGSVSGGEWRGGRAVTVSSVDPGRHAEIRASHIGTLLVVRQSGRSLGLSLLTPRAVARAFGPRQDLQLCVWGCPTSQRLDTLRPPPSSPPASAGARAHCASRLPARDVYYRACVFDLLTSGDLNSSDAAVAALHDARHMISERENIHLSLVDAAERRHLQSRLLLLLLGMLGTLTV